MVACFDKTNINYIRFMDRAASHNMVSAPDTGVRQEPLSESTVMGHVTLHFQVSHKQCNDVSVAIHFNPLAIHICVYFMLTLFNIGRVLGTGIHQRAALLRQLDYDTSGSHPPRDEFQSDSQFIFHVLKDWAWD